LRTSAGKRSLNDLVRAQQHRVRNRDANLNFQLSRCFSRRFRSFRGARIARIDRIKLRDAPGA
jgi:hypothetical protein